MKEIDTMENEEDLADRDIPSDRSRREAAKLVVEFSHFLSALVGKETHDFRELRTIRELQDIKQALLNG